MNSMSIVSVRVKEIISRLGNISMDRITLSSNFRTDLGLDSLDLVELIMAFEDEFGGEVTDEDAQQIHTVGEVVKYIEQTLLSQKQID